jgi:hypothetical protein
MNGIRRFAGLSVLAALAASSTVAVSGVAFADDGESSNGSDGHAGAARSYCQSVGGSNNSYSGSGAVAPTQCLQGVGGGGGSY